MMTTMFAVEPGGSLAFLHRPATASLSVAIVCTVLGWLLHGYAEWRTRSRAEDAGPARRPPPLGDDRLEPPAVVGLLTNDYDVPRSALTATAIDLASRGWVRFTTVDGELVVVTRASAAQGDSLRPFEQQVLNHLASRAFNDVTSANTLAMSHHRLNRRWWLRFGRAVAAQAQALGLSTRRYSPVELLPSGVAAAIGLLVCWFGARGGDEVALADSWKSRLVWIAAVAALGWLAWSTTLRALGSAQRPTDLGVSRTALWMGYRARLPRQDSRHATVLGPPAQQRALAQASVMGVAEQVLDQIPAAPEDHRAAWSEAGGTPHLVQVRYPIRPGYGQHPLKVAAAGIIVFFAARWVQGFLGRVSDGESLQSLLDRVPGQVELIEDIAAILAFACWAPIIWAVWAAIAGAVDSVATRERSGSVIRARRPAEVLPSVVARVFKPFAERDRFSTYLAVDDGRRRRVAAWLASERSAAPQGAQATVRATPLLGYVRSSEPVGTATRSPD